LVPGDLDHRHAEIQAEALLDAARARQRHVDLFGVQSLAAREPVG
jgi:hypothetical protein